jgi:hypothetical protein
MSSTDPQTLALLSLPHAPRVELIVFVKSTWAKRDTSTKAFSPLLAPGEVAYIDSRTVQRAVWWPSPSAHTESESTRELFGEIHLSPKLALPISTPNLRISVRSASGSYGTSSLTVCSQYKVGLMPFEATGYKPPLHADADTAPAEDRALQLMDIGIVSAYAPGGDPRPIPAMERAYGSGAKWSFHSPYPGPPPSVF